MKKKFDRNIFGLLANSAMHNIINIYMNTFLVAYILNVSLGNFFTVAMYYVITYATLTVSYIGFSFIAARYNKPKLVALSVIIDCFILVYMASLKDNVVNYIYIISFIYNIVKGLYWSSLNSLSNEVIKGKKLQSFNTYSSVVSNITSIVVPVAFGSIIDSSSLFVIATFLVAVGILQIISTLFMKSETNPHKLDFKGYYQKCYNSTNKKCYKLFFMNYFMYGYRSAISTLITMLIVLTFATNTSLGLISSLISVLVIITLIVTNKMNRKKLSSSYMYLLTIVMLSMLLLIFNISKTTIIIFNICFNVLTSIVDRTNVIKRSGIIRAENHKEYIIEHQAVSEMVLNMGRLTFYAILVSISFSSEIWVYKLVLGISIVAMLIYGMLTNYLEKEYTKVLIEKEFKKQHVRGFDESHLHLPTYSNPNYDSFVIRYMHH